MGQTLYDIVKSQAQDYQGVALTFRHTKITYAQLLKRIDTMAQRLWALGVRKDDVICLCSPNIPQAVFSMYALNKIGAIAFIVHPLFPAPGLDAELQKARAKMLLVLDQRYAYYRGQITACPLYAFSVADDLPGWQRPFYHLLFHKKLRGLSKKNLLSRVAPSVEPVIVSHDDRKPSFYLESGGTTGRAKIVVLNDRAVNYPATQATWILEKTAAAVQGTAMIGVLPMFHGFGLGMGIHAPLANRATSALMVAYNGREIVNLLKKGRLNYLICIPYMARKLLAAKRFTGHKLQNLSHAFIGADKPPVALIKEFDQRMQDGDSACRLAEGYGLTETVTVIAVNRLSARKIGSVGQPLPGVRLRIVDENGRVLAPNTVGQIQINCPCLMLGYLNDEETTKKALISDDEGHQWLQTGDAGWLDEDGYLYFKERRKNIFKVAGHNVFPTDIETLIGQDDRVAACAAIPIANPVHPYINLYVQPKPAIDDQRLLQDLKAQMTNNLIRYSVPEKITLIVSMPRTNVGKIDRQALTAAAKAH